VDGKHSRLSLGAVLLDNLDLAVKHDEQAAVAIPLAEERGVLGQRLPLAVSREQHDLLVGEPRVGTDGVGGLG
jgi:hypothetical protein